ncbi:MAG TPA: hypothetical protein DCQ06_01880 [Myxococcales bacterium]|nr:hypothetical protein [Myxococcales bacterium]HAN30324.1 hypothetical protein [Myxococcales bacterium]
MTGFPSVGFVMERDIELCEHVATGGQGQVWRAHERQLARDVSVKILPAADPWGRSDATEQQVRAIREGLAMARLLHPAIASVHHVGQYHGHPYVVSTWYPGEDLRQVLNDNPPSFSRMIQWLQRIGEALQHAHDRGVFHCDLKPENIVIRDDVAPQNAPVLIDFGLARGQGLQHRTAVQSAGTACYLPPEAGHTSPGPHTDQYALAKIAQESLSESLNDFEAGGLISSRIEQVIAQGSAPAPNKRFESVGHFVDALLAAATVPTTSKRQGQSTSDQQQDQLVMAALALCDDVSVLDRAFPQDWLQSSYRRLHDRGVLQDCDPRSLISRVAIEPWIGHLSREQTMSLHERFARAIEQGDMSQHWVAQDAAHHWLHAGQVERAGSILLRQAQRERQLETQLQSLRAATKLLRASGASHIEACLCLGTAAAKLGWRRDLELAVSQALVTIQRREQAVCTGVWRLRGQMRLISGQLPEAHQAWRWAHDSASELADRVAASVGLSRSLSALGRPDEALAIIEALKSHEIDLKSTAILVARGIAYEGIGDRQALKTLRLAARLCVERADPLEAGEVLLILAEAARRQRRWVEADAYIDEAAEVLDSLPTCLSTGAIHLIGARCALDQGQAMAAYASASSAASVYRALRLHKRRRAAWSVALEAANVAHQPQLARHCLAQLQALARAERVQG